MGSVSQAEVVLRTTDLSAIFHPFDPSPLESRTVSDAADEYVLKTFNDLDSASSVTVRIQLPPGDSTCCREVQEAFRKHFRESAAACRSDLRDHFRDALRNLAAALVFALVVVLLAQWVANLAESRLLDKVASGLSLAAWVSLWKPTEMLIHDWRPLRRVLVKREQLAAVNVVCEPFRTKDSD
jgi:uncharacterized paraquat-inducible protein A